MNRVLCLVDGFNLYHALVDLQRPWLKWLDLRALAGRLVHPKTEQLEACQLPDEVMDAGGNVVVRLH